ncbi:hypothetical protein K388_05617 [Streptomyces sp. KhCrAH-43]|uniref:hypothetical protein n=1 Tax=unclassified Streptomyces TaxID=2593676 RepID=UPI000375039A|nr:MULTISPECIES: hypothetical protein [unclassified Streptomyces]MYX67328.1 hypothetical protein [Streptomyces sp. SID8373]RAJ53830.1 hypothetical protein K388_05617 [Streptomyces sp. KhCrAH-43]
MDFKPGGLPGLQVGEMQDLRDIVEPHPWKARFFIFPSASNEQLEHVATVMAFQAEIDLLDTSWLDEQP